MPKVRLPHAHTRKQQPPSVLLLQRGAVNCPLLLPCCCVLQTIVIDARGHMLGRLASVVAKQILSGYQIVSAHDSAQRGQLQGVVRGRSASLGALQQAAGKPLASRQQPATDGRSGGSSKNSSSSSNSSAGRACPSLR
jgi:hypothetical protein